MKTPVVLLCLLLTVGAAQPWKVAAADSPVVGVGHFTHIVEDFDRSLAFYRDVLGLEVTTNVPFANTPAIMALGNTPGAQSRMAQLRVPGSQLGVELIQYKDIDRKPQRPRFQDPGAANLMLNVRDLTAILPKLVPAGGRILTPKGEPATIPQGRFLFIQDPDGFVVELAQTTTPPATAPAGNVYGGNLELTVDNSEESVKFYNELLGFEMVLGKAFNDNQQMAATAGTPGASFRQSRATIPGSTVSMTLIEFKNIERKRLSGRTQDPGTAILQLRVSDVTALTQKLKAAGATVVTTGGAPVEIRPGLRISLVRDPNDVLLELMETR